jgi:hypothetical protein
VQNLPKLGGDAAKPAVSLNFPSSGGGGSNQQGPRGSIGRDGGPNARTMKFNNYQDYSNKNKYTSMAQELFEPDNFYLGEGNENFPTSSAGGRKPAPGVHLKSIESRDDLMQNSWPKSICFYLFVFKSTDSKELEFGRGEDLSRTAKHAKGVKLAPLGGGNIFGNPLPSLGTPQSHPTFKSPAPNKGAKLAPMGKIF